MSYIAPISHAERLRQEANAQKKSNTVEEVKEVKKSAPKKAVSKKKS